MNRQRGLIISLLVLALIASACGGGADKTELIYRVDGSVAQVEVEYKNAQGEMVSETVSLPWETTLKIGDGFDFKINVENADDSGSITCEVWINERKAGGTSGVRLAECSGSFSGSKSSFSVAYHGRNDAEPASPTSTPAPPTPTAASVEQDAVEQETVVQVDRVELLDLLSTHFSENDLRDLCFILDVGYDDVPGETRTGKARELILYMERRSRLPELVEAARQLHPDIPWDGAPQVTAAATVTSITEFETYTHDVDCAAHNEDLKLRAFSVLYPSGAVIQDCTENPENYVLFSLGPDENSEDAALLVGLGKLEVTPPDRATYVSNANRFLSMISTQLASQYAAENLSSDPIIYQGETVFHQDMKAVVEDVPRLIRLVTIPNFEHGHGVLLMAMQKVDGAPEAAFPAFDQVTRKIIESVEFAPVEPTIGPLTFATQVTEDAEPVDPGAVFPAGATIVYGVFEYADLYPAMTFGQVWYLDGAQILSDTLTWGDNLADGKTWVYYKKDTGIAPGSYEVQLFVDGELLQTGSFAIESASATWWFDQGADYHQQGDYENAIAAYSQAIELDPSFAEAYYGRGFAYHSLGNYAQAITDYTEAIAMNPGWDLPYLNQGLAYVNTGDTALAIADFLWVLEISTDPAVRQEAEEQLRALGVEP